MKNLKFIVFVVLAIFIPAVLSAITGKEILDKSEAVMKAPKSVVSDAVMVLIDKRNKKKTRKIRMWSKGSKKKVIKFLSPADVRGVGLLVLSDNDMYLYMPAFKKIRRIASHVKHQSFMGSDFSYDEIGSTEYAENYTAKLVKETDTEYIVEAVRKKNSDKQYNKLKLRIDKQSFLPLKIEMYKKNKLRKVLINNKIEKIGKYWMATDIMIEDIKKKHKTNLKLTNIKFDKSVPSRIFTKRYLTKSVR